MFGHFLNYYSLTTDQHLNFFVFVIQKDGFSRKWAQKYILTLSLMRIINIYERRIKFIDWIGNELKYILIFSLTCIMNIKAFIINPNII